MIPRHLQIALALLLAAVFCMGFYALHLKRRTEDVQQQRTASLRPIAPPPAGPPERVTLYLAFDDQRAVRPREFTLPLPATPTERARELLRAVLSQYLDASSTHPLGPGSDIKDVYLLNPNTAVIDTNAAFADTHRSGVLVEELTVASLVQTLSVNLRGIQRVKFLVEGHERETLAGHADLRDFYDVSAVNHLVLGMQ
jgi:hypothetical protein